MFVALGGPCEPVFWFFVLENKLKNEDYLVLPQISNIGFGEADLPPLGALKTKNSIG